MLHPSLFTVEGLSKHYGDLTVFRDFSFYINKGDRLAITGQNGAGKTTLMNLLSGADPAFDGSIRTGDGVKIGYYTQENEKNSQQREHCVPGDESSASTTDITEIEKSSRSISVQQ